MDLVDIDADSAASVDLICSAIDSGDIDSIRILTKLNVDLNSVNTQGRTLRQYIMKNGDAEIKRLFDLR